MKDTSQSRSAEADGQESERCTCGRHLEEVETSLYCLCKGCSCSSQRLTLRLGAVVVEVLLPLRGDQLAHVLHKQSAAAAVRAQPAWTEDVRQEE